MKQTIRVLHVVTYMGRGGLETMLMNYYRHIDRTKVQFDFLVHRDFEADYDREINELGGKIYHVSKLIPWSRKYKQELKCFFKDHPKYRIVHVHQDCLSSVALKCAEECGIPVRIAHSHSSSANRNFKYYIKKHYMKFIPKYATDLVACGKQAGDWMFGGSPYRIVRNAIDINKYSYDDEKAKAKRKKLEFDNEFIVGHVGQFRQEKNHIFLLRIMNELLKKRKDAKLLLVGDGEGRKEIVKKAKEYGIAENVVLLGNRNDVNELMQVMNVFVLPSLYEGVPLVLIEAQASGLPCVISDRVSKESIIVDSLVDVKQLSQSESEWADLVLTKVNHSKKDYSSEMREAGYDIITSSQLLQDFYLSKFKELEI